MVDRVLVDGLRVLSFLLLASSTGQPLPADAAARCSRLPVRDLTFVPTASTTWRSDDGHVLLVAWADEASRWHVGEHGITLATGRPWPLSGSFEAPSGIAFELTQRLTDPSDASPLVGFTGAATVVRLSPDGTGIVGAPPTGGGSVHVADGDGLVAVSDRAGIAALGAGGAARRQDLPALVRGLLLGDTTAHVGVDRVPAGAYVAVRGRLGAKVNDEGAGLPTPPPSTGPRSLAGRAADQITALVEQVVRQPGDRWLELGADPGSLVLAAAVAATGTTGRIRVRPASPRQEEAARRLATKLGVELESPLPIGAGGEGLDARVRRAVNRTEGMVAPTGSAGGLLGYARDGEGVVLGAVPGGALAPDPGATGRRLLTSQAWTDLDATDRTWAAGRGRTVGDDATRHVLAEVDLRTARRQAAAAALAGGATLIDPTAVPAVTDLALAAAAEHVDPVNLLVEALHPPLSAVRTLGGEEVVTAVGMGWRTLAPVLEAHVLGHGRERLTEVLDLDEVAMVVRSGIAPDADTARALEGALALAVWAGDKDVHAPARPRPVEVRPDLETPDIVPTLVTGVTSRSLLDLAGLSIPLDATEQDALLGVRVDRDVRDLVHRLLLAVGATPGQLPVDLDRRLSGPDTAHLVGPARALLARRGGTIADPRLALTLPFWRAHVATPRVVLVAERPPDLSARTTAQLPLRDLLGWWVDAMTAAAASGADVRIVDPGDLSPNDDPEATGWDGLAVDGQDAPDLVRVVRTVDSLVREVELDAARPLLRTIRQARATDTPDVRPEPGPATAPLHVVDELWERAVEADRRTEEQRVAVASLKERLAEVEAERDDLRGRSGFKAAWQVLTGRDS